MAGTEKDFKVKKGLTVTDDINVSGDINVSSLYGRLNFKKNAAGNVNNDAIYFINASDQYAGAVKYFHGDNTLRFDANQATQLHISDGVIFPPVDSDVDLGTTSLRFKDTFVDSITVTDAVGRDAHNQIKFSTDDQIIFRVGNADGVTFKASGEIEATKFDGALEGNADTASVANRVVVVANDAAGSFVNENNLILFSPDGTASNDGGNLTPESSTDFHYNPSTTILTVPKITSAFTGNVDGTATNATAITLGGHLINDVDIGTELVDTDDHIMSSGAIKAYVDANGGGATTINGLTDVKVDETNFVNSFLIQTDSDGSAPTFTGTLNSATGNIGIGKTVLTALESGDENIGFGTWALKSLNSGGNNTAVGSYAGRDVSSGTNNVMLGASAGYGITTGTYNIALGTNTLSGAVTGSNNIAIGATSQNDTTSGAHNISLGAESMSLNTNGSHHIGIGYRALKSIGQSGGSGAIAIGKNAYQNATSGGQQIAIGEDAMGAGGTSGGSQNIAIGWEAGKVIDNADYNTFIGTKSGKSNTSGSRNTAIGTNAYDAATSENDNIAIGYDALGGAVNGGDKNVMIGNYAGDTLSSGTENVGVGYQAHTGGSGFFNVAVGSQAGKLMTSNSYQTLVGYQAGQSFNGTNARFNTAIGYQAMGGGTSSPHQNTALGAGALYNVNGVSRNNIGIGYQAGVNQTAGSGNVIIGSGVDVASTTGSRQLAIAGNDGSTTTTWITGDSTGLVDIPVALEVGTGAQPLPANGVVTIINDDSDTNATLLLMDNESDATNGPVMQLYRNSASPADNDILGRINFNGEDSAGDARAYSSIRTVSTDVTNGTHDGVLHLNVAIGGTQTDVVSVDGTGGYGGLTHSPSGIKTLGNVVGATSTANNNYITLLAVPHANFKAIKASVHITDSSSNEVQTMDVMCHYDGSAANFTEYGIIYDGAAPIGEIEVDINSSNIRIRFKNTQGATRTLAGSIHAVCHP